MRQGRESSVIVVPRNRGQAGETGVAMASMTRPKGIQQPGLVTAANWTGIPRNGWAWPLVFIQDRRPHMIMFGYFGLDIMHGIIIRCELAQGSS